MVLINVYLGTYEVYESIIEHLVKTQKRALLFTGHFNGDCGHCNPCFGQVQYM